MDKRRQKSQKIIMEAFLELLKVKNIEKISMNEIADKANVNRGTIYLNFTDKYDLLNKCIEANFLQLITECRHEMHDRKDLSMESLQIMFEYLESRYDFLRILFKNVGFAVFKKCMHDEIVATLRQYQPAGSGSDDIQSQIAVQFLASAVAGVLEWWFANDLPCSAAQISKELWELLQHDYHVSITKAVV